MPSKRSKADLARAKAARKGKPVQFPRKGPRHNPKRDAVVLEIVGMMNRCEWVPYESSVAVRLKHGITLSQVTEYSAEASRHIRLGLDQQEARAAVLTGIDLGVRKCLEAVRPQYDQMRGAWTAHPCPNLTALKDFLRLRADVLGLTARQDASPDASPGVDVSAEELAQVLEAGGFTVSRRG